MFKRLLLLLSIISLGSHSIYSMNQGSSSSSSTSTDTLPKSEIGSSPDSHSFYTYAVEELQNSYARASKELKAFIRKLQNAVYIKKPQIRAMFFIGKPGTDKTTSAVMVAYKLQDKFNYEFVNCPELTGENRGAGTVALRDRMELILYQNEKKLADGKGVIIILDEIQELLDHADDPHYDTASMGRYLTSWLNEHRINDKVFLIATCNDCGTFPDQIRSRMVGHIIEFKEITGAAAKLDAFLGQLKAQGVVLHPSCTPKILIKNIENIKEWSGRDFESLVSILINQFFENDNAEGVEIIEIDLQDIKRAIQTVYRDKEIAEKSKDAETDQQQRERHHKEDKFDRDTELIHKRVIDKIRIFLPIEEIIDMTIKNHEIRSLADFINGNYLAEASKRSLVEMLKIMKEDQIVYLENFIKNIRSRDAAFQNAEALRKVSEPCCIQ
jgi:Cdc6-like AAA superfamily ATPase